MSSLFLNSFLKRKNKLNKNEPLKKKGHTHNQRFQTVTTPQPMQQNMAPSVATEIKVQSKKKAVASLFVLLLLSPVLSLSLHPALRCYCYRFHCCAYEHIFISAKKKQRRRIIAALSTAGNNGTRF